MTEHGASIVSVHNIRTIADAIVSGYRHENIEIDETQVKVMTCVALDKALPAEIRDMLAFIEWSAANNKTQLWVSTHLAHDIGGIARNEIEFVPRTAGYSDLV